ncbi:hypothetical protein K504DRAFT_137818 [Pleomassaria siparia CBS 279.74]|uniref:Uncharacterized protein n=1 Tax=Pleomassaria siparia CBS 279.74 TaxID=1314801 RepID=A0A6G1KM52_9PLEO|nr:hypothetical protein K504DRAFT_137818 [Pleomassaria siparia CBS 279.74]
MMPRCEMQIGMAWKAGLLRVVAGGVCLSYLTGSHSSIIPYICLVCDMIQRHDVILPTKVFIRIVCSVSRNSSSHTSADEVKERDTPRQLHPLVAHLAIHFPSKIPEALCTSNFRTRYCAIPVPLYAKTCANQHATEIFIARSKLSASAISFATLRIESLPQQEASQKFANHPSSLKYPCFSHTVHMYISAASSGVSKRKLVSIAAERRGPLVSSTLIGPRCIHD